ncbi:hypothetical protein EPI10_023912 [Gossypium australe]|uniref:Uncharacterized protein n=1 Tax=Gossypium australe TaxID=47621 RepID=A0A5B6VWU4_9ROSI|nr:hypothetical protein EPI10_023912 [Gossypium australe]
MSGTWHRHRIKRSHVRPYLGYGIGIKRRSMYHDYNAISPSEFGDHRRRSSDHTINHYFGYSQVIYFKYGMYNNYVILSYSMLGANVLAIKGGNWLGK